MMNMMEANKMKVLAEEEMKQYRELTGLADYYKKKSEEDPDNRMNDHWFNFYNDRVVVFLREMDMKYGFTRKSENRTGKSLSDMLRQPFVLQAC